MNQLRGSKVRAKLSQPIPDLTHQQPTLQDRWTLSEDTVNQYYLYSQHDICFIEDDEQDDDNCYQSPDQPEPASLTGPNRKEKGSKQLQGGSENDQFFQFMKSYQEQTLKKLYLIQQMAKGTEEEEELNRGAENIKFKMRELRQLSNFLPSPFTPPQHFASFTPQSKKDRLKALNENYQDKLQKLGGKSESRPKTEKQVNFDDLISLKTFRIGEEVTLMNEKEEYLQSINLDEKVPLSRYKHSLIQTLKSNGESSEQKPIQKRCLDASMISLTKFSQNGRNLFDLKPNTQPPLYGNTDQRMMVETQSANP